MLDLLSLELICFSLGILVGGSGAVLAILSLGGRLARRQGGLSR